MSNILPKKIFLSSPHLNGAEIDFIKEVIDSTEYTFHFDASDAEDKESNVKLYILYEFDAYDESTRTVNFKIKLSKTDMPKTKKTEAKQKLVAEGIPITETELNRIFLNFSKQITTDFFICKDAEKFLTDQFDELFYRYIYDLKTQFDSQSIEKFKILRKFAIQFIKFVAHFENELVKIWTKPKFVVDSNFIITFDKIQASEIKTKIIPLNYPRSYCWLALIGCFNENVRNSWK